MKHSDSFFPIQTSTQDQRSQELFKNEVEGGVSVRFETALRIYTALLSNHIVMNRLTAETMVPLSFKYADLLIEENNRGEPQVSQEPQSLLLRNVPDGVKELKPGSLHIVENPPS